jgi:hypothetical protein
MKCFARGTTLATVLGLMALTGAAQAEEEKIAFNRLPKAVIKTIKAKFPKAEIKEAVEEEEDDETTYEVSLEFKGQAIDVTLKPNGTIVEVEKEIEFDELPRAVKKALAAMHPEAKVEKAEVVTKGDGPPFYELVVKTEVVFTAKGKRVEADETEESDEKPAASARKARKESKDEDDDDEKPHSRARKSGKVEKDDDDKPSAKARKSKKVDDDDDDEMKDDDDARKQKPSAKARKSRKGRDDDDDDDDDKA